MDLATLVDQVAAIGSQYTSSYHIEPTATWLLLKLQEELGELTQSYLRMTGQTRAQAGLPADRRRAFEDELADVVCIALLLARHEHLDLESAISRKWLSRAQPPASEQPPVSRSIRPPGLENHS